MTNLVPTSLRRNAGRVAAGIGSVALVCDLWDVWYTAPPAGLDPAAALSAWEAFQVLDVVLFLLGAAALALVALDLGGRVRSPGELLILGGTVASGIVLARIAVPPAHELALQPQSASAVALAAALLVAAGGRLIARSPAELGLAPVQAFSWAPAANPRSVPPPSSRPPAA